jgi:hypothetical protein
MLKDHGFVIPGNVNDRVPFSAGDDAQSRALGAPRVAAALRSAPLAAAAARLAKAGGDAAGARRLEAAARSLHPFCGRGGGPLSAAAAAVEKERRTVDALLQQCSDMLAR